MATSENSTEGDLPSPCIKVCRLDETGWLCLGCHRTLDEIAGWSGYTPAQKQAVLERLSARKADA